MATFDKIMENRISPTETLVHNCYYQKLCCVFRSFLALIKKSSVFYGRVGEGRSDTPICDYNIPPVTNQKLKKSLEKESRLDFCQKNKKGLPCA